MFTKPKGWLSGGIWRPKNPHSLEHLKYLYGVLGKNQTVTEQNRHLLVETLRSISEILIWGDQNDSSVFDFFLEKNMLSFFLRFMRQKSGRYICVQLLQTLNILFENISNETSVYYLLSNNHINSIIVHKFDFSDEEVMAYYISFLKTLSLKLNKHTIHFFYNEHTNDFALYTEAIKFFNHSESMVRIAVRTITLNVYKVDDKSMLRYIRDKTAAPYFSNLVWFIGNHILELDACVRNDADHNSRDRLADLVAEHLDHLHYLNDILCLKIEALNEVLTDHLLNRLFIPLYVYSLTNKKKYPVRKNEKPSVHSVVSLFLLSQVFLIISHAPLVRQLADIIFNGDLSLAEMGQDWPQTGQKSKMGFVEPDEPLAKTLEKSNKKPKKKGKRPNYTEREEEEPKEERAESPKDTDESRPETPSAQSEEEQGAPGGSSSGASTPSSVRTPDGAEISTPEIAPVNVEEILSPGQNSTDEEKLLGTSSIEQRQAEFSLENRPYLEAIFSALECEVHDYESLFSLCLLYALGHNGGINQELLDSVLMPTDQSTAKDHYNIALVEKLIKIITLSCQNASRVRLATLEMSILLLKQLVYKPQQCFLQDRHLAAIEGSREEATLLLRNFYKSEEIFLDMFEDEHREMHSKPLNVEYLTMDASILLPPTMTPLTGIEFSKRLPCGEVERARRAIRVFFHLRELSLTLRQEPDTQLPLTKLEECVKTEDVLDLNNSDLIACTVIYKDKDSDKRERRFLVIDVLQLILVEPDIRKLGWGVVRFVGFLQDVEVTGDKDDSRSLHITVHKPSMNAHARPIPLLSARFQFDDHIRCMAAKQRLTKGRLKARQRKMQMIAKLLEMPTHIVDSIYQPSPHAQSAAALRAAQSNIPLPGRSHPGVAMRGPRAQSEAVQRSVFASVDQVQGFSAAQERDRSSNRLKMPKTTQKSIPLRGAGAVARISAKQYAPKGNASIPPDEIDDASPEIETAEEAEPSPEAKAFQSLNSAVQREREEERQKREGRHSRNSSSGSLGITEIPLEDMSKKTKGTKSDFRSAIPRRTHSGVKMRSSSSSPIRGRHGSTSSLPSPRSSPLSRSPSDRERSSSDVVVTAPRRDRSSSQPIVRLRSKSGGARPSNMELTSFTINPDQSSSDTSNDSKEEQENFNDNSNDNNAKVKPKLHRHLSNEHVPKSLTPAKAPALSLVCATDTEIAVPAIGSPHLIPPVDSSRIRSVSDVSSSSAESDPSSTASGSSDGKVRPPIKIEPQAAPAVVVQAVTADPEKVERSQSSNDTATEQLAKIAQKDNPAPVLTGKEDGSIELKSVNITDEAKEQTLQSSPDQTPP